MDMRKYSGVQFVKPANLESGPRQATIIKVSEGKYEKPDLLFDTGECLSLNATNNRTLMKAYGPNSVDWCGMCVELYVGNVEYQGRDQESVLVRPVSPAKPKAERTPLPAIGDEMSDEIPF